MQVLVLSAVGSYPSSSGFYSRIVICSFWWKELFMACQSLWGLWLLSLFKPATEIEGFFLRKAENKTKDPSLCLEVCKLSSRVMKQWEVNWNWLPWEKQ